MAKSDSFRDVGVKTAKRGTIYIGTEIITSIISLFILIYLARVLAPANFGLYTIAIAFSQVLYILGNFAIGATLRKKIPEAGKNLARVRKIISSAYSLILVTSVFVAICGLAASGYLSRAVYSNAALTLPIALASVSVIFSVVINMETSALIGMGKVKESSVMNFAYTISQLVIMLVIVGFLKYGLLGATSGYLISTIIGALVGAFYILWALGWKIELPEKKTFNEIFSFSTPLLVSTVVDTGITNFGVVYLAAFVGAVVIGNYGAAFKLGNVINLLFSSTAFIVLPAYSYLLSKKSMKNRLEEAYNSSIYYTMLIVTPLVAFIIAAAVPLINLLVGSAYVTAPSYLSLMVIGLLMSIIGGYGANVLIGTGQIKKLMWYQILVVVIDLIFLVVLVPLIGAYGAIVAVFIVDSGGASLIYMRLMAQSGIRTRLDKVGRIVITSAIVGAIMFGASSLLNQSLYSIPLDLVIAIILYPPLIAATGGVNKHNLDFVRDSGRSMAGISKVVDCLVGYTGFFVHN